MPLPVEPLFDLALVPQLIPCSMVALKRHLVRFSQYYRRQYRLQGTRHNRIRVLLASEIVAIRGRMIRQGKGKSLDVTS